MMVTVVVVLLFSVVAMLALVRAARGHAAAITRIEELPEHTQPVDLEAFRNLMNPSEERYLRENLSPGVKLRFFAGLTTDEAAQALGMSPATAYRQWAFAQAWLARAIGARA